MKKLFYAVLILLAPAVSIYLMGFSPGKGDQNGGNQQANKAQGASLNLVWEEVGPNNMGTICRSIVVTGTNQAFAGSVGGGLWKTTNGGLTWVLESGVADNLAVGAIAADGNNLYVGTGETFFYTPDEAAFSGWDYTKISTVKNAFHQYAGSPGEGVFVSTDGGSTWTHNNGTWNSSSVDYNDKFMSIQKLAAKNGKVYVASLEGLYWSSDALATVTKSNGTNYFKNNPILDVEIGDGNYVYAATMDSLYVSSDGGLNFGKAINSKLPNTAPAPHNRLGGYRVEIAVSPSQPTTVYVTGASDVNSNCNGVWKSTDNGNSWVQKAPAETAGSTAFSPLKNKGRYALALSVDPSDPDAFLIGGQTLYSFDEVDGLVTAASQLYFPGFIDNYVPISIHTIAHDPNNPDVFYIGTDQEIVKTTDGGETYTMKTKGFNCGHHYSINAAPNYKIIASERIKGVVYKNNASSSIGYQEFATRYNIVGRAAFSLTHPNLVIAQGSDGGLVRSLTNGDTWEQFYGPPNATHPCIGDDSLYIDRADSNSAGGGLYDDAGAPITPWVFDEVLAPGTLGADSTIQSNPTYIFMCSGNFVWQVTSPFGSIDSIPRWTRVSPDLVRPNGPKEYLTAIAVSGDNTHTLYVGTNYGKIFRIAHADDPENLDACDVAYFARVDDASMPKRWITSFAFDPSNPNNLVVTYGGYDGGDAQMIYLTNNALVSTGAVTWRGIDNTNTPPVPIYSAAIHPDPNVGAILIGREDGVYSTTDDYTVGTSTITWNNENANGMSSVPVYDIQIRKYYMNIKGNNYSYAPDHTVFIATHGRGIYKSSTVVARDVMVDPLQLSASLYPNPVSGVSKVEIQLPEASQVKVEVYSLTGVLVGVLANGAYGVGTHDIAFDSANLRAGIYLVKASVKNSEGEFTKTMKSIVVK
ncbi:MAG: T9SS type A sorting domain-containing protein [Bacteroidia bacterium]|nr:T9SS type A sorting domain-containing protein [Bacteroidia bacterium]